MSTLDRRGFLQFALLALAVSTTAGCGTPGSRAAATLKSHAALGINVPLSMLAEVERQLSFRFSIVGGIYYTFDTVWARHTADLAPAAGRELMVCWMPKSEFSTVRLSDISTGLYDHHIDEMLAGMRSFDGPVVCRWGHEPNGNWYTWSCANPAGGCSDPREYVNAWRYIVARERAMPGKSNVRWFWCANAVDVGGADGKVVEMEHYWPGGEWVDLAGCDAFNEPSTWASFRTILQEPYDRISALGSQPFVIGEVGCHEALPGEAGSKTGWIEDMLNTTTFPKITAVCYFDYDGRSEGRADWRLNSTSATVQGVISVLSRIPPPTD